MIHLQRFLHQTQSSLHLPLGKIAPHKNVFHQNTQSQWNFHHILHPCNGCRYHHRNFYRCELCLLSTICTDLGCRSSTSCNSCGFGSHHWKLPGEAFLKMMTLLLSLCSRNSLYTMYSWRGCKLLWVSFHYLEDGNRVNPLTPVSDSHLLSPYNITPKSHTKVMRIKDTIRN